MLISSVELNCIWVKYNSDCGVIGYRYVWASSRPCCSNVWERRGTQLQIGISRGSSILKAMKKDWQATFTWKGQVRRWVFLEPALMLLTRLPQHQPSFGGVCAWRCSVVPFQLKRPTLCWHCVRTTECSLLVLFTHPIYQSRFQAREFRIYVVHWL